MACYYRSLLPLSLLLLVLQHSAYAIRIPFEIKFTDNAFTSLSRRAPISIGNTGNAQYVANITIAGNDVPVLLDTGSSDLWVYFAKPPADPSSIVDTGTQVSLAYAVGTAAGHAQRTAVTFGNYTVNNQAFLLVEDTSSFTGDIRSQGYQGLFGLGPNTGSVVRKKLDKKNADTMLQNIFNGLSTPKHEPANNYITMLLDRQKDGADPFKGVMTISEIAPGFENITSMPRLDVETVTRLLKSDQHWQALTDKDIGVIGPDGLPIEFDSIVPRAPDGQLVAVLDSGFTFSQVPRDIADAIYGRVKGAVYDTTNEWWLVPCGQYLNISFNFGGKNYPIHPFDVVDDNFNKVDSTGRKVCIGSFQPITTAFSLLGHYDMILGMNFMRSVYTLFNFGSWIENGEEDLHPYIQMVSHTNAASARAEFVQLRLNGQDTIATDSRWQLLPADQLQRSPVSDEEKKKKYQEMVLSRWPYILLGCLVFVLSCIGYCTWRCCCRKGRSRGRWTQRGALKLRFGKGGAKDQGNALEMERERDAELYTHGNGSMVDSKEVMVMPSTGTGGRGSGYVVPLERTQSHSSYHSQQQPSSPYYHQQQFAHQQQQGGYESDYQQQPPHSPAASHYDYPQPQQQYHQQSHQQQGYNYSPAYPQQSYGGYEQQSNTGYGAGYSR